MDQGNNNSGDDSAPVLGQTFLEQGADEQAISEAALNKLVGTAETFDLEVTIEACGIVSMFTHAALIFCKNFNCYKYLVT
jgi:DNA repair protein RAD5